MAQLEDIGAGEFVSITLSSNEKLNGCFYCYDPESASIIIQNEQQQLIWINGHNIQSIKPSKLSQSNSKLVESLLLTQIELESKEILQNDYDDNIILSAEVKQIQQELMEYLSEHQLSPKLDERTNKIEIGTALSIIPPYSKDCCRSKNEIVLSTILNLLDEFYTKQNVCLRNNELIEASTITIIETKEATTDSDDLLDID